jgi:hypothetical protein
MQGTSYLLTYRAVYVVGVCCSFRGYMETVGGATTGWGSLARSCILRQGSEHILHGRRLYLVPVIGPMPDDR